VKLCKKRGHYTEKLASHGYKPIGTAKGTKLYARYEKVDRQIKSVTTKLRRARESQAKKDFHDTIDDLEIDKQLDGAELPEMPTRAKAVEFEFRERASIVQLMSLNLTELEEGEALAARVKFIRNLARYCHKRESRRLHGSAKAVQLDEHSHAKRKRTTTEGPVPVSTKRPKHATTEPLCSARVEVDKHGSLERKESTNPKDGIRGVADCQSST